GLSKANITIRNFPESVDKIRKKTKIQDGGKDYLFFIRDQNQALQVLHCAKLF
ncbi:THUMP-like domain-containing protein, partial [Eudoraea sp.]|uniref:THUMP-like domain-containing protein n=1 Tax=Eudoraea sp. TaxID=1979955 RepID=UPI003C706C4D